MKKKTIENVPEWSIYALEYGVNEDPSLVAEDKLLIDKFIEENFPKGYYMEVDWNSYTSFCRYPCFGLATGTYTVNFYTN